MSHWSRSRQMPGELKKCELYIDVAHDNRGEVTIHVQLNLSMSNSELTGDMYMY